MANVAEGLIGLLRGCGVDVLYGVTGDAVFPFFDALGTQQEGGLRFIGTTNETAAAFMASYHAKLTGRLGVCVASSGPGTANLVNGLADAYFDGAPVLAITGQVALDKLGTGTKQEVNQQQLLAAVTASSQLIVNGAGAMHAIARAIEKAICERTVTHVSIPHDVFHHEIPSPEPSIEIPTLRWQGGGFSGNVDEAAARLQNANNPLILVGEPDPSLRGHIEGLADRLGAGIVLAQQAKGVIPDDHPNVLGGIGEAYIPGILAEVDCVLQIGTAAFEKKYFGPHVATVQLVGKTGALDYSQASLALMGNLADVLGALLDRLDRTENGPWREKISQEKMGRRQMIDEQQKNESQLLHPGHVITVLSEVVPPDAVIACDIGAYVHWFDSYFMAKEQTVLISSHWRSLGAGLPGALSAAVAQPDRRVIALIGDGGMLVSMGELCTAVRYRLPVTVVVLNNRRYEIEQVRMEHQGLTPFGVDTAPPDFAAVAQSCGAEGRKVTTHEELVASLQESLAAPGPVVLDVQVAQTGLPFLA